MLFPTIEFCLFFLVFLFFYSFISNNSKKIYLLAIFNIIFYSFFSFFAFLYLLFWSFLLFIYPKIKFYKKTTFFVLIAIFQISFWKLYETGLLGIHDWKMPLGISFFTFQGLTYLFALEKIPSQKENLHIYSSWDFLKLFAFIGFFPTVFSGPILRAKEWETEISKESSFTNNVLNIGLGLIALGTFYKLCLASYLHSTVSQAFSSPSEESSSFLWLGMYSYGFEIFFDFAGYSLMSIGIAKLFGFTIPNNFNQPYLSSNIRDFWTKWHMSLSSWFKDYIYLPLGGSKVTKLRQNLNISIVMITSGLWHGLSGNYLAWGLLHLLAIVFYHNLPSKFKLPIVFSWFINLHYVFFAWIFFRSNSFSQAIEYISSMFQIENTGSDIQLYHYLLIFSCFLVIFTEKSILHIIYKNNIKSYLQTTIFWSILFIIILMISPSGLPPFIYFQY